MITIITNPRPFCGIFDKIQRNALSSWIKFCPGCQIILFEDEEKTTGKVAAEFGLDYVADAKCNEFGTPLIDDVINIAKKMAKFETLAYVNTDILLLKNFVPEIEEAKKKIKNKDYFISGQRYNLDIDGDIDVDDSDFEEKILGEVAKRGKLYSPAAMDYWVFPRNLNFNIPPFVIGKPGIDGWLVYKNRVTKNPVIDMTPAIKIVHQNHNYPHAKKDFFETEKQRNLKLAGGFKNMITLRESDWVYYGGKLKRPKFPRNILSWLILFYPWRVFYASVRITNKKLFIRK